MKSLFITSGKQIKTHFALLALAWLGFAEGSSTAQELYWTDGNLFEIKRAVLVNKWSHSPAGRVTAVLTNALYSYLAFDQPQQRLYFTVSLSPPQLFRCRANGSEMELLLTFDVTHYPRGLAVDAAGGKIYWSSSHGYEGTNGKIRRANLDGSGVEDLVTDMSYPYGMALDLAGGKMFWIRQESQAIWRANLDGSQAESFIVLGGLSYAFGVAVSPTTSQLFWTDGGSGSVGRANLDGSDVRSIATLGPGSLESGIMVDPVSATVFWGDTANHAIYAAGLNGESSRVVLSKGVNYPTSLAVIRSQ